jgi:hypothetical protein
MLAEKQADFADLAGKLFFKAFPPPADGRVFLW